MKRDVEKEYKTLDKVDDVWYRYWL